MTTWSIYINGCHICNYYELGLAQMKVKQLKKEYPSAIIELK
jgi:hypothetical protein